MSFAIPLGLRYLHRPGTTLTSSPTAVVTGSKLNSSTALGDRSGRFRDWIETRPKGRLSPGNLQEGRRTMSPLLQRNNNPF